jgi:hypothetical protein
VIVLGLIATINLTRINKITPSTEEVTR